MYEKPDYYAKKAKQEGYQARSVYKLEEIQQKYGVIRPGQKILDVGAAPGSWSQYALKLLKGTGLLAAIDLSPLTFPQHPDNFRFIQGDIFEEANIEQLRNWGPYNLVMSDAAPSTTGNRIVDTSRSEALVDQVIRLGAELLLPGGCLVAKVFQGGNEQELTARLRELFTTVRILKPKAVRKISFETYLIGQDRK